MWATNWNLANADRTQGIEKKGCFKLLGLRFDWMLQQKRKYIESFLLGTKTSKKRKINFCLD
mgnify:CR=1 FL=1